MEEDKIFYFSLDTYNFNKKITYLLNKSNKKFIDIENHFNCGNYEMDNNILYLHWQNGKTKKFLSNSYHEEINYENIKIIKPISVKIQDNNEGSKRKTRGNSAARHPSKRAIHRKHQSPSQHNKSVEEQTPSL